MSQPITYTRPAQTEIPLMLTEPYKVIEGYTLADLTIVDAWNPELIAEVYSSELTRLEDGGADRNLMISSFAAANCKFRGVETSVGIPTELLFDPTVAEVAREFFSSVSSEEFSTVLSQVNPGA